MGHGEQAEFEGPEVGAADRPGIPATGRTDPTGRHPEHPPEIDRTFQFGGRELAGIALLLLLPVLALGGWLGDNIVERRIQGEGVDLRIEIPGTARHGNSVQIRIEASGANGPPQVEVDAGYLEHFRDVLARPAPTRSSPSALIFAAPDQEAGDLLVVLELTPVGQGWARGVIRAHAGHDPAVELSLKTFILP